MAITKMQKVTLIISQKDQPALMRQLQNFQEVELSVLKQTETQGLDYFQADQPQENQADLKNLQELQGVQTFIQSEIVIKKTFLDWRKGRPLLTLGQLEKQLKEYPWQAKIDESQKLEKQLQATQKERQRLNQAEQELLKWQNLDCNPADFDRLVYSEGHLGVVDLVQKNHFEMEFKEKKLGYFEEIYLDDQRAYYLVLRLKKNRDALERLERQVNFQKYDYPFEQLPTAAMQAIQEQISTNVKSEKQIRKNIVAFSKNLPALAIVEDALLTLIEREKQREQLSHSEFLVIMTGWIPEKAVIQLKDLLECAFEQTRYYLKFQDVSAEESDDAPIQLENNRIVAPFETLTEMYSLPRYDEIDPTPLLTPFYLVFFGMMVADIGYGALLALATLSVLKLFKLDRPLRKNIEFFHLLAYPTMIWGVIYGSAFGVELFKPLLSTSKDVNAILLLSIIFGFIQIIVGLIANGYIHWKRQEYSGILGESLSWIGILVGAFIMILANLLLNNGLLFKFGGILASIGAILVVFVPMWTHPNKIKGFVKGLYALYGVTGYVGDLVSYTRLMAIGIAGGSIAAAFNMIVGFLPMPLRLTVGVLLMLILHGMNIFLSYLSAYVHGIRLQYVEFFGKFYQGGGRKFSPFKTAEKNTYLIQEKQKEN